MNQSIPFLEEPFFAERASSTQKPNWMPSRIHILLLTTTKTLYINFEKGVAAARDHDIGTTNLHIEVSDIVNILVSIGIAKGNGVLSKSGKLENFIKWKCMKLNQQ